MTLAGMQPYFFPYIGYFQLMKASDIFMMGDDFNYIKESWSNRNRILIHRQPAFIHFPLEKASPFKTYQEINIKKDPERLRRLLITIEQSYSKAKEFENAYGLISGILNYEESNLALFILNSISAICEYLDLSIKIKLSSTYGIRKNVGRDDKVIALCKAVGATSFINPIGGIALYSKEYFRKNGVELLFLKSQNIEYKQYGNTFTPWLSIIDVLMFNSKQEIREFLDQYDLV